VPYCTPRNSPLFQYRPSIPERVLCAPGSTFSDSLVSRSTRMTPSRAQNACVMV
jgi:hypothetical protein